VTGHAQVLAAAAARLAEAVDADGVILGVAISVKSAEGETVNHTIELLVDPCRVVTTLWCGSEGDLELVRELDSHLYVDLEVPNEPA
jgi:hypothetical protein